MSIILASQSTYRKHALDILGLTYEVMPSDIDESAIRHEQPSELAKLLSEAKAKKIGDQHPNAVVIAADLFVVHRGKIIGKPTDEHDARRMLGSFSGEKFEIVTGLAVFHGGKQKMLSGSDVCVVRFRELSDYEIDDYVKRYPVVRCAGSFEADGLLRFAEHIEGSYNFKAALPVDRLVVFLRQQGVRA